MGQILDVARARGKRCGVAQGDLHRQIIIARNSIFHFGANTANRRVALATPDQGTVDIERICGSRVLERHGGAAARSTRGTSLLTSPSSDALAIRLTNSLRLVVLTSLPESIYLCMLCGASLPKTRES